MAEDTTGRGGDVFKRPDPGRVNCLDENLTRSTMDNIDKALFCPLGACRAIMHLKLYNQRKASLEYHDTRRDPIFKERIIVERSLE